MRCPDTECGGEAEPEMDEGTTYYECVECGLSFGYELVGGQVDECALGVPEEVRRQGGVPVEIGKKP